MCYFLFFSCCLRIFSLTFTILIIICIMWICFGSSYLGLTVLPVGLPGGSDSEESAFNAGDLGLIPGLGRSPGEVSGYLLQYSCLENSMDSGAWRATEFLLQIQDTFSHNFIKYILTLFSLFFPFWIPHYKYDIDVVSRVP